MAKNQTSTEIECVKFLKLLADETRLSVIRQLMQGPLHVGELNEFLEMEQSLLSHHLRILRDADLVHAERDGKSVLYSLSPQFRAETQRQAIDLGCCRISFHS